MHAARAHAAAARRSPATTSSPQPGDVRLRIGVALQDAALDPKQTGAELLRLQGRLYGLPKRAIEQRVRELGELIDLGDALDRRIGTYSGGMKRRLDLAAALVHNPEVLFLDEPTTGLDPVSRARVWEEVRRLNDELGMTIFLTTQYLEEADELADRVGIIDRGRIVAEGTPDRAEARGRHRHHRRPRRRRRRRGCARPSTALDGVQSVEAHGDELIDRDRRRLRRRSARSPSRSPSAASRSATSPCARRRSTTCSSS